METNELTCPQEPLLKFAKKTILDEAASIISGDRQECYGHPESNFKHIAAYWSILFGIDIYPKQVAEAMILTKLARNAHNPKRDNLIDIAGYAGTMEMLEYED